MNTLVEKQLAMNDEAVEFFRQVGEASLPATAVMYKFADLMTQYDLIEEADQLNAALTTLISDCGYDTDYKTLLDVFSQTMASELGCWAGGYMLFDEEGTAYPMLVGRDGAQVLTPLATEAAGTMTQEEASAAVKRMTLQSTTYKDGTLTLSNDRHAFSVRFPMHDLEDDEVPPLPKDDAVGVQPRCEGTVAITVDGKTKTLSVKGKRGSYTRAGVEQSADGDPAATWAGVYQLYETTDRTAIQWVTDRVTISVGADGMEWSWGSGVSGDHYQYQGNVLLCSDADDDMIQYAMRFSLNADGTRQLALAKVISGQISADAEQTYVGFWAGDAAREPVTPAPNFKVAARKAMAVDGSSSVITWAPATPDDPSYLTKFSIDLTQLSTTAGSPTAIPMPFGVYSPSGNAYVVTINLSNTITGKNYTWTTAPTSATGDSTPRMHLQTVTSDTTGATVTFTFSGFAVADVTTGTLSGIVKVTDNSANPITYYMQMQIPVVYAPPIVISPTSVPAPVQGLQYTAQFTADGGQAQEYMWFDTGSVLPTGLTFNPNTQQLTGTPATGDGSIAGTTYMLYVAAYAPQGWVMNSDSIAVSLPLTPYSEILSSDASYATTILGIIGGLATAGGVLFACYKKIAHWQVKEDVENLRKSREKLKETQKFINSNIIDKEDSVKSIVDLAIQKDREYLREVGSFKRDSDSVAKRIAMVLEIIMENKDDSEAEKEILKKILEGRSKDDKDEYDGEYSKFNGWTYGELDALKNMIKRKYKKNYAELFDESMRIFKKAQHEKYNHDLREKKSKDNKEWYEKAGDAIKDAFVKK